jgi:hypothetical protein
MTNLALLLHDLCRTLLLSATSNGCTWPLNGCKTYLNLNLPCGLPTVDGTTSRVSCGSVMVSDLNSDEPASARSVALTLPLTIDLPVD